jgi:hypothetical protein
MRHDIDTALDQCLIWLRSGLDIESCLARYPEYANELRPLLEMVAHLGHVIAPPASATARAAGEQRMLAALASRRKQQNSIGRLIRYVRSSLYSLFSTRFSDLRPTWNVVAALTLLFLIAAGGATVAAAQNTLPGDALYPVKLAGQRVHLVLTFDPEQHQRLQDAIYAQRRLDIQAALKTGRQTAVDFQGTLQQIERDQWTVGGLIVTVQKTTAITGEPHLGTTARVRGIVTRDGTLLATEVRIDPTPTPRITETPTPTSTPQPTHTDRPTPAGDPTWTVEPTERPAPTDMPEPAHTRRATETLNPADTPEPGMTPEPGEGSGGDETHEPVEIQEPAETPSPTLRPRSTETPEPGETPEPTATPEPSETPEPTETPEPGESPEPGKGSGETETPKPTKTSEPEDTPKPTKTPEPTETPDSNDDSDSDKHSHPTDEPDDHETDHPDATALPSQDVQGSCVRTHRCSTLIGR